MKFIFYIWKLWSLTLNFDERGIHLSILIILLISFFINTISPEKYDLKYISSIEASSFAKSFVSFKILNLNLFN